MRNIRRFGFVIAALVLVLPLLMAQDTTPPPSTADKMIQDPSQARGVVLETRLDANQIVLVTIVATDSIPTTQTLQLIPEARVNLVSDDGQLLRLGHLRELEKGMYAVAGGEYSETPGGPFLAALVCAGQDQGAVTRLMDAEILRRQKNRPSLTSDGTTSMSQKVRIYN